MPEPASPPPESWAARLRRAARNTRLASASVSMGVLTLAKCLAVVLVTVFLFRNGKAVEAWVLSIEKFEAAGIKIDRDAARQGIEQLLGSRPQQQEVAQAAVIRATHVAPAIVGSRLLWVDSVPAQRQREIDILESLGIRVQIATSVADVLRLQRLERFDVIITRLDPDPGQTAIPAGPIVIDKCGFHQFEVTGPASEHVTEGERPAELSRQIVDLAASPPTGFELAERLATLAPRLVNRQRSFLIFYSAFAGDSTYANRCARLMTDRADAMLHAVVSLLEEANWRKLQPRGRSAP